MLNTDPMNFLFLPPPLETSARLGRVGNGAPDLAVRVVDGLCVDPQNAADLRQFLRLEAKLLVWRRLRVSALGTMVSALCALWFLLEAQFALNAAMLAVLAAGAGIGASIGMLAMWRFSVHRSLRNQLARRLYSRGMRVEGRALLTNVAHPDCVLIGS